MILLLHITMSNLSWYPVPTFKIHLECSQVSILPLQTPYSKPSSRLDFSSYPPLGLHFPSSTASTVYSHCSKQTPPFKTHVCHYITSLLRTCLTHPPSLSTAHPCRSAAGITWLVSTAQVVKAPTTSSPPSTHSLFLTLPQAFSHLNINACCSLSLESFSSGLHHVTFTEMSALKLCKVVPLLPSPSDFSPKLVFSPILHIFRYSVVFYFFITTSLPWLKYKNYMRAGHFPATRTVPASSMCSDMSEWR